MRDLSVHVAVVLAMGISFGFIMWILENMREFQLFVVIAFVLGGFAEAMRRWMLTEGDDDG